MFTKFFRIGGILLMISTTTFGWISFGQKNETKFWNIGAYSIASVSARDDEWEDDEDDSRDTPRKRDDDEDERYRIQENIIPDPLPLDTTPVVVTKKITTPISTTTVEPCVTKTILAPISFEKKILQTLGGFGFDVEQRHILQLQFQELYSDISRKYPTSSGRIEVLQQLSSQAESKINELRSISNVDSNIIFTTKIQSLQALRALVTLQIESIDPPISVETNIPCTSTTSPTVSAPTPAATKKVTTLTPVKTIPVVSKPTTPTKTTTAPVTPKPVTPIVNTRTTAS